MKRLPIKLVLFLLLGAIINVAVAWGCAAWSVSWEIYQIRSSKTPLTPSDVDVLDKLKVQRIPGSNWSIGQLKADGFVRRQLFYDLLQRLDEEGRLAIFTGDRWAGAAAITQTGWPMLSLQSFQSIGGWMGDGDRFSLPRAACPAALGAFSFPLGAFSLALGASPETPGAFFSSPGASPPGMGASPRNGGEPPREWGRASIRSNAPAYHEKLCFVPSGSRGRWLHCGYDLRGHIPGAGATPEEGQSITCPECGLASR